MWAYFDASALMKRYLAEAGRREVLRLLRRYNVVTSAVAPIELRSALRRRVAEGTVDEERVAEILERIAVERAFWALMELSREVLGTAETLVATHPLRALDAIHVASARLFADRVALPKLVFVSADVRQAGVATALGLTTRVVS